MATGAYFAFSDDLFTRLIGHQTHTQVSYEDQIADLRAQIDRIGRLDQERVEQQIKPLLQRQATFRTSHLGVSQRSVDSSTKRFACEWCDRRGAATVTY
jgi:hypothetical protein